MEITNSFTVPLPVERAWEVLLDVPRIAPCMPGAKLLSSDAEDGSYSGEVQVRLGPVLLAFRGKATMTEVVASDRRAVVRAEGRDTKGRGSASADIRFALTPDGNETRVNISTNLTLSGSVAQYGRSAGMINDLANHITRQFADNLRQEIGSTALAEEVVNPADPSSTGQQKSANADHVPDTSPGRGSGEQRQKPISGLRLGIWLIWRQLMRLLSRAH